MLFFSLQLRWLAALDRRHAIFLQRIQPCHQHSQDGDCGFPWIWNSGQLVPAGTCSGALAVIIVSVAENESAELGPMLRQLHSADQGARAKLQASLNRLGCSTLLPVLLRLFSALVALAK